MEFDIQKKMVCRSGIKSEILSRDREAGSWLLTHTHTHTHTHAHTHTVEG